MKIILITLLCLLSVSLRAQNQPSDYKTFYDYEEAFYASHEMNDLNKEKTEDEHEGEWEHFNRLKWYFEPRLFPSGNWVNTYQHDLEAELKVKSMYRSSNGKWQSCGPTNVNSVNIDVQGIGRVNRIEIGQSGAIYAATAQGGLWKRVGTDWTCLTNFIPNLSVSGIAIDPNDENVIYIISGDADGSSGPVLNSLGIFKTNDGGVSWYKTGYQPDVTVGWAGYKIVEHPTQPNILMVVSNAGILRTTDSGLTWDTVATGGGAVFFDIEMKPGDPNTWYACTKNHVFRSTNAGLNWTLPHATNSINVLGRVTRTALAVTQANPNVVYILSGSEIPGTKGFVELLKCTNPSTTFSFTSMSSFSNSPNILGWTHDGTDMNASQASYDLCIAVSATNENQIYIGGINIWYNGSGGASGAWSLGSYWANDGSTTVDKTHADQHELLMYNDDLYVGNDGGIYFQDRQAIDPNWDPIYVGLNITQFYKLELDPTDPNGNTLLGSQDNGVKRYDGDDNFQTIYTADGGEACIDPTDHNRYYFYVNDNLYKDGCDLCWPGLDSPQFGCGCPDDVVPTPAWVGRRSLEINPLNNSQLFSGYTCLFRTNNGGSSWAWLTGIPCTGRAIVDLDFDVSNRLWVTKDNGEIFRETSSGSATFTQVSGNLPMDTALITSLACSSSNPEIAFVTFSGYLDGIKVFETIDGGTTWFNISGYLPNVPVNCIVYQPNTDDGLYIGTDIGVFYYDNSIVLWTPFRNGMPSVAVADLEISTVDNMLYAATFGRGLWKSDLFTGCQSALKILDGIISTDGYVGPFQFTSGYNTYRTIDSTIINMPLTGGLGQNTLLISEGYIKLKEGFQATNTDFTAKYDQYCFNGFYSYLKGEYAGELSPEQNQNPSSANDNEIQLSVYPNPFTKELKMGVIVSNSEIPIQVFFTDLAGKIIAVPYKQSTYDGHTIGFRFDTSELADGAYIISVQSGNFTQTKKVIKLSAE